MDAFDKIRLEYESILVNIELRYKNLAEDYEETIACQAGELYDLEMSNDELREGDKTSSLGLNLSLDLDEAILRAQDDIARLNLALFEKKAANKELT